MTSAGLLAAAYTLHLAATVVWVGGLVFLSFFSIRMLSALPEASRLDAWESSVRRFRPLAWLCVAVFIVTGLMQMSANAHYAGLLVVHDSWSRAILVKHLIFGGMAALLAYQTWVLAARLERVALGLSIGGDEALARLRRLDFRLTRISAVLGILILVLTALARASN
ncbi:MAG TPA: CopD family protein [Anaerolineales bacterium]|nr:CopD family protein [Anaerolineales bacterium]